MIILPETRQRVRLKKFKQHTPFVVKDGIIIFCIASTKKCPVCGNQKLLLATSMSRKTCTDCSLHYMWKLEDKQKSIY